MTRPNKPELRSVPKFSRIEDDEYLAWVRAKPCCCCVAPAPSDPHHFGRHGHAIKTDDLRVVPLCRRCHDDFHRHRCIPRISAFSSVDRMRVHLLEVQVSLLIEWIHFELPQREPIPA